MRQVNIRGRVKKTKGWMKAGLSPAWIKRRELSKELIGRTGSWWSKNDGLKAHKKLKKIKSKVIKNIPYMSRTLATNKKDESVKDWYLRHRADEAQKDALRRNLKNRKKKKRRYEKEQIRTPETIHQGKYSRPVFRNNPKYSQWKKVLRYDKT